MEVDGGEMALAAHGRSLSLGELDLGHDLWDADHSTFSALGVPAFVDAVEDDDGDAGENQRDSKRQQQHMMQHDASQPAEMDDLLGPDADVEAFPLSSEALVEPRAPRPRALSDSEFMQVEDLFGSVSLSKRSLMRKQSARDARERARLWWNSAKNSVSRADPAAAATSASGTPAPAGLAASPAAVDARILFHASSRRDALQLIKEGGGKAGNFAVQVPFPRHNFGVSPVTARTTAPKGSSSSTTSPPPNRPLAQVSNGRNKPDVIASDPSLTSQSTDANSVFSGSGRSFLAGIMGISTGSLGFSELNPFIEPAERPRENLKRTEVSFRDKPSASDDFDYKRNKRQTLAQLPAVSVIAFGRLFANSGNGPAGNNSNNQNGESRGRAGDSLAAKLRALRRTGAQPPPDAISAQNRLPMYFLL